MGVGGRGARLDPFYTYDFIAWFRHGGGPANIANRDSTSALWDTSTDALGTGIGVNVLFVDGHVEWLGFSDFHPWICSYWRSDTVAARRFNWR